ncbi:MAG: NAD(P)-dependent oxidoreductase [Verrucomicrobia bacterium]|nr:NAD(P)-dependent oxidoreductase [Verrucomicrobiota bacterium]
MKILVTGAGGFIGARVCQLLAEQHPDAAVAAVTWPPTPSRPPALARCEWLPCDLLESGAETKLPGQTDVVIHLAGDPRNPSGPSDFTAQILSNVVMTSRIADYAARAKTRLVVFASSGTVYSGGLRTPFAEDSVALPADHLGASKLAAESLLKARALAGHFKALTFRIFTAYGPGARPEQFVPQAIAKLRAAGGVAKFGNPEAKRDFIYVDDVARLIVAGLALRDASIVYEVLNAGTGRKTSVREVVQLLAGMMGTAKRIDFETPAAGQPASEHQADMTRTLSTLDWRPRVSLEAGLRLTLDGPSASGPV